MKRDTIAALEQAAKNGERAARRSRDAMERAKGQMVPSFVLAGITEAIAALERVVADLRVAEKLAARDNDQQHTEEERT